jgi:hypothetical protein
VLPLYESEMMDILGVFDDAEIIPDWDWSVPDKQELKLLEFMADRPCTLDEIAKQASLDKSDAVKYAIILEREGKIKRRLFEGKYHFQTSVS